ncbi:MAG: HAD-IB family phosphatase [Candidatus Odinarchaeota archaeon]
MNIAVLCDFDGTIAETDITDAVFDKFVCGNWRIFNEQLDRDEISLEQCMKVQFSMIKASKSAILKEVELTTAFRPGFEELVHFCNGNHLPFEIVSAGLDFVINHLLEIRGLSDKIRVHAAKTKFIDDGIAMGSMELRHKKSIDFKDDLVNYYKDKGYFVLFIGDGMSDKAAVRSADLVFVIKGSRLAEFCKTEGINHQEMSDFQEVIAKIKKMN